MQKEGSQGHEDFWETPFCCISHCLGAPSQTNCLRKDVKAKDHKARVTADGYHAAQPIWAISKTTPCSASALTHRAKWSTKFKLQTELRRSAWCSLEYMQKQTLALLDGGVRLAREGSMDWYCSRKDSSKARGGLVRDLNPGPLAP